MRFRSAWLIVSAAAVTLSTTTACGCIETPEERVFGHYKDLPGDVLRYMFIWVALVALWYARCRFAPGIKDRADRLHRLRPGLLRAAALLVCVFFLWELSFWYVHFIDLTLPPRISHSFSALAGGSKFGDYPALPLGEAGSLGLYVLGAFASGVVAFSTFFKTERWRRVRRIAQLPMIAAIAANLLFFLVQISLSDWRYLIDGISEGWWDFLYRYL